LSKHQQVQLLEAAAILSHLSPTSSSLPDDRSLWPSFLSGGSLPPPDPSTLLSTSDSARRNATNTAAGGGGTMVATTAAGVSSSVPASASTYARSSSTGPRMHDYSIPVNSTSTHIRPGLFGVHTALNEGGNIPVTSDPAQVQPMSVPITTSLSSYSWSSLGISQPNNNYVNSLSIGTEAGGWSLPRSAVRSRSGSTSDIDEQEEEQEGIHDDIVEIGDEVGDDDSSSVMDDEFGSCGTLFGSGRRVYGFGAYSHHRTLQTWKHQDKGAGNLGNRREQAGRESKEWDEMEMEMEMD